MARSDIIPMIFIIPIIPGKIVAGPDKTIIRETPRHLCAIVMPNKTECLGPWSRIDDNVHAEKQGFITRGRKITDANVSLTVVRGKINILSRLPGNIQAVTIRKSSDSYTM